MYFYKRPKQTLRLYRSIFHEIISNIEGKAWHYFREDKINMADIILQQKHKNSRSLKAWRYRIRAIDITSRGEGNRLENPLFP